MWSIDKSQVTIAPQLVISAIILCLSCVLSAQPQNLTGKLVHSRPRLHHGYYFDYSKVPDNTRPNSTDANASNSSSVDDVITLSSDTVFDVEDFNSNLDSKTETLDSAENSQQKPGIVEIGSTFSLNNRGALDYSKIFPSYYVSPPLAVNPFEVFDKDSQKDTTTTTDVKKLFDSSFGPLNKQENQVPTGSGETGDLQQIRGTSQYKDVRVSHVSSVVNTGSYDPNVAVQSLNDPFDPNNYKNEKYYFDLNNGNENRGTNGHNGASKPIDISSFNKGSDTSFTGPLVSSFSLVPNLASVGSAADKPLLVRQLSPNSQTLVNPSFASQIPSDASIVSIPSLNSQSSPDGQVLSSSSLLPDSGSDGQSFSGLSFAPQLSSNEQIVVNPSQVPSEASHHWSQSFSPQFEKQINVKTEEYSQILPQSQTEGNYGLRSSVVIPDNPIVGDINPVNSVVNHTRRTIYHLIPNPIQETASVPSIPQWANRPTEQNTGLDPNRWIPIDNSNADIVIKPVADPLSTNDLTTQRAPNHEEVGEDKQTSADKRIEFHSPVSGKLQTSGSGEDRIKHYNNMLANMLTSASSNVSRVSRVKAKSGKQAKKSAKNQKKPKSKPKPPSKPKARPKSSKVKQKPKKQKAAISRQSTTRVKVNRKSEKQLIEEELPGDLEESEEETDSEETTTEMPTMTTTDASEETTEEDTSEEDTSEEVTEEPTEEVTEEPTEEPDEEPEEETTAPPVQTTTTTTTTTQEPEVESEEPAEEPEEPTEEATEAPEEEEDEEPTDSGEDEDTDNGSDSTTSRPSSTTTTTTASPSTNKPVYYPPPPYPPYPPFYPPPFFPPVYIPPPPPPPPPPLPFPHPDYVPFPPPPPPPYPNYTDNYYHTYPDKPYPNKPHDYPKQDYPKHDYPAHDYPKNDYPPHEDYHNRHQRSSYGDGYYDKHESPYPKYIHLPPDYRWWIKTTPKPYTKKYTKPYPEQHKPYAPAPNYGYPHPEPYKPHPPPPYPAHYSAEPYGKPGPPYPEPYKPPHPPYPSQHPPPPAYPHPPPPAYPEPYPGKKPHKPVTKPHFNRLPEHPYPEPYDKPLPPDHRWWIKTTPKPYYPPKPYPENDGYPPKPYNSHPPPHPYPTSPPPSYHPPPYPDNQNYKPAHGPPPYKPQGPPGANYHDQVSGQKVYNQLIENFDRPPIKSHHVPDLYYEHNGYKPGPHPARSGYHGPPAPSKHKPQPYDNKPVDPYKYNGDISRGAVYEPRSDHYVEPVPKQTPYAAKMDQFTDRQYNGQPVIDNYGQLKKKCNKALPPLHPNLPPLKYSSGDPYPPNIDENYRFIPEPPKEYKGAIKEVPRHDEWTSSVDDPTYTFVRAASELHFQRAVPQDVSKKSVDEPKRQSQSSGDRTYESYTFPCKGKANGFHADVGLNCEVYYKCKDNGMDRKYKCPAGMRFNRAIEACDFGHQVMCGQN